MEDGNKNNENKGSEVVQKKSPERFDFQNAGLIDGGMGLSRNKEFTYITFIDNNGKKFNEVSYTNLGQFYVPYYIDRKKKLFEAIYVNHVVEKFNNQEEAQVYVDKLKKGKNKKDEYIIRHEFVYSLTYGLMHEIEYDAARAENITVPETDMKKMLPFTISELVRIGFGWKPQDNTYTIINLYKVTGQDTYTAGIFMEDYAIYTEGAKSEQDAQSIITDWQSGKIQYKIVQGTQLLGKLSGGIAEEKYSEGELQFIRPVNILFEELVNPNSNDELYRKGGYIRTKAKQLKLINEDGDEITKEHLQKIDELGGIWQRRVKLYKTLYKMENGGKIKDEKTSEVAPPPVPTIEDEIRKYANDKNEVSESNLKILIGGKDIKYPIHTVGTIKLKKQFLKPYYKIIDSII